MSNRELLKSIVGTMSRKADAPSLELSVNPIAAKIVAAMECRGRKEITQEELKELFYYDSDTGLFTWKKKPKNGSQIGQVAGSLSAKPDKHVIYVNIQIGRTSYMAHNLAWLYVYGEYPPDAGFELDHVDRDGTNNRLSNLRPVTPSQQTFNQRLRSNNTSGHRGVTWHGTKQKWQAYIGAEVKRIFLGWFDTFDEAVAARQAAELKFYGELSDEGKE